MKNDADLQENDDEETETKENTWDDILADSADEDDENDPIKKRLNKKGKKDKVIYLLILIYTILITKGLKKCPLI